MVEKFMKQIEHEVRSSVTYKYSSYIAVMLAISFTGTPLHGCEGETKSLIFIKH